MNEPTPHPTDDELSELLDGLATPELAAPRVEADPQATARLEELRRAARSVHDTPVASLTGPTVDDLVARALAAADAEQNPDESSTAPVAPLRSTRRSAGPSWLVAAVIVLLVATGLALVWSGTHGSDADVTATGSADDATRGRTADEAAPEAGATADGSGSAASGADADAAIAAGTAGSLALPDLGDWATAEELRSSLAEAFPADAPPTTASGVAGPLDQTAVDRCSGLLQEVFPVEGTPTNTGFARVAGEHVVVYEYAAAPDDAPGTTVATPATTLTIAVSPASCDPLFTFQR